MAVLLSESFTGTNGTNWSSSNWTTNGTGAGGGATIQSNAGKLASGTAGGYAGAARTTRTSTVASRANCDISGTVVLDANEPYGLVYARATMSTVDVSTGYQLLINKSGTLVIEKVLSFTPTTIATTSKTLTAGTTYGFRFQAIGTAIKARVWTGAEPGTWDLTATDSSISSAGLIGLSVGAGNAAVSHAVTFDDVVITDGVLATVAETVTVAEAFTAFVTLPAVAEAVTVAEAFTAGRAVATVAETCHVTENFSAQTFRLYHDLKVEIEFTTGVWTDVTQWLQADIESVGTFGRPTKFDDVAAATWTSTLRNSDGRFTPTNPNSPYYPNVVKGRGLRVSVNYSGQNYPRFWGHISSITLPALTDVSATVVQIQAADIMATLARKVFLSPFVEESRRQARITAGGGCDVFAFPPSSIKTDGSIQVADTSFENKGRLFPGSSRLGTITVMPVANDAGSVTSSGPDSWPPTDGSSGGVLSEGQLSFEVGDNGFGKQAHPILACKPQVGFLLCELFFKVPLNVLPPRYITGTHTVTGGQNWNTIPPLYGMTAQELAELNPADYPNALTVGQVLNISATTVNSEWVLADLWAGSTEVLRIVLSNNGGKLAAAFRKPGTTGAPQYIYTPIDSLADDKWRKITIARFGTSNSIYASINDTAAGSAISSLAGDLTAVDTIYIGGRHDPTASNGKQVQCPPISISGVGIQATNSPVRYWMCLGAPPANVTVAERFQELLDYTYPIQRLQAALLFHPTLDHPFDVKVVRTSTAGRTALDCLQELARTVGAYLWVQPENGYLTLRRGPDQPTPLAPISLITDVDVDTAPQWKDSVDVQPTRVTSKCPAGEVTSVNTAAESDGQYKESSVDTCAATVAWAKSVGDGLLAGSYTLHLTNLQVDLVHAETPLWSTLLPTFPPTEQSLRITDVPLAVFGYNTVDATIESWTETYTVDSARFAFETTPFATSTVNPGGGGSGSTPTGSFTTTSSVGAQSGGTVAVTPPSGTSSGDLLLAIMTVDNTGSVAGMAAPDSSWTAQGAGGGSSAGPGYGQVWTKVAGTSEPASYTFRATGTGGSSVLITDAFTGTNGSALNSTNWVAGETRTGATATIQSNTGQLNPGTGTAFAGRISINANTAAKADVDVLLSFQIANNDTYPQVMLRGDTGGLGQTGYELRPGPGAPTIARVVGYSNSTGGGAILGTITGVSVAANTWYRARFQTAGSTIRARVWLAASVEPSSWGASVTDTTYTAAGPITIANGGGSATGSITNIDDVVISDPNAVAGTPEAKLTLLRINGADATAPVLLAPSWTVDTSATSDYTVAGVTPTSTGLLVNHWHILATGGATGGSGGGAGGSAAAFSFGIGGFDTAADITNLNAWLTNHSLKAATHWTDNSVSSQQGAFGIGSNTFASWTGILDLAVGGIFTQAHGGESGGDTWAHAAAGTYDSRWTTALNNIKAGWGSRPAANLHIRFAHEMNGNFSEWAVSDANAANFRNAWIRFANLVHTLIPGAQMVWSPNDGTSSLTHVDDLWPGSAYVDVIGVDSYNAYPHVNDLASWTSKTNGTDGNGNPVGIEKWRQYALAKGKPMSLPEWGNPAVDVGGGAGGGDAPDYAQRFLDWCKTNGGFNAGQVKYANYFNIGTVGGYPPDYLVWASGTNGTVHQPNTAAIIRSV